MTDYTQADDLKRIDPRRWLQGSAKEACEAYDRHTAYVAQLLADNTAKDEVIALAGSMSSAINVLDDFALSSDRQGYMSIRVDDWRRAIDARAAYESQRALSKTTQEVEKP